VIWKRALLFTLLTVTGLALETSAFGSATLLGAKPELMLLVVVALAMGEGPAVGATAGFVMGLGTDLLLQGPGGISALVFTLAGYAVGRIRATLQHPSAWTPMVMVCLATFFATLAYALVSFLLGVESLGVVRLLRNAALASAYNALLTPFLFPVVRTLGARMRPKGASQL
jgi:rod shape-determining protein MreD